MSTSAALPVFQPGQTAAAAHAALQQAVRIMDQARHCAVLWFADVMARGLYRDLGFPSIQIYAQQELGFSRTRTGDFVRMARKLDDLPQIRKSLETGKLGYTKAREIIKVATPATEKAWVEAAHAASRSQLEKDVARVRAQAAGMKTAPGQGKLIPAAPRERRLAAAVPVKLSLEMTPEQFARFEALQERLVKSGVGGDRVERILAGLDSLLEDALGCGEPGAAGAQADGQVDTEAGARATPSPGGAADLTAGAPRPAPRRVPRGTSFQVHVRQCPDCGRFSAATSRGEVTFGPGDAGRVTCDSRRDDPRTGRNTATIPPRVRRRVLARDGHRCQGPGCRNTRFLEVHHVLPRARGGTNRPDNLITLCSACHRHVHEKAQGVQAALTQEPRPQGLASPETIPQESRSPAVAAREA
ncbi:MAG: HNH endonuclease [Candidatus Krumholzibacteriia bacterium]